MCFARLLFGFVMMCIAGCTQTNTGSAVRNAGLNLYTSDTSLVTQDLQSYFAQLCLQSDPFSRAGPNGNFECRSSINSLVRAGFNDIDLRCDAFLASIDRRRNESSIFNSSITAANTLAAGLASADSLRTIAQALGFATSVYNISNQNLLTSLESSTIKRIVYERRRIYREEFLKVQYGNYPDAVFALRGYLRICTPQTIVLSANDFAFAGAAGLQAPDVRDNIRAEMNTLSPLSATDQADIQPIRPNNLPDCPECTKIFAFSGVVNRDVELAQQLLCELDDGSVGPDTRASLAEYDAVFGNVKDNLISNLEEWENLQSNGCTPADIEVGILSPYEKIQFRDPNTAKSVAELLFDDASQTTQRAQILGLLEARPLTEASLNQAIAAFRQQIQNDRQRLSLSDGNIRDPKEYSTRLNEALVGETL